MDNFAGVMELMSDGHEMEKNCDIILGEYGRESCIE